MATRMVRRPVSPSSVLLLTALQTAAFSCRLASAAVPVFENAPYVQTLYEMENTATTLVTFNCTDADGDATVVSLPTGAVTPSTPCGSCFSVLPCSTEYCLIFTPVDTLDQQTTPTFDVTVECTAGGDTVTETVDIRLTANVPPRFDPNSFVATTTVSNTKTVTAGQTIYDVNAVDDNNDNILFSVTSDPVSSSFEIGAGDGIIRAANDLISECINSITFYVNITDGVNSPVGPLAVQVTLDGSNVAPDITNLDLSLQVPEDTADDTAIRTLVPTDDDNTNQLTYTLTANPSANLAFFEIANERLKVQGTLDYETLSYRNTNLTITADDGSCTSSPRYLYVTVTDVNEPPNISPENASYSVYEGADFRPSLTINWDIDDEDFVDTRTYAITDGNSLFSIDPTTGQITPNGDYDIDNNNNPTTQTFAVQVTDKGGLTDTTYVTLTFKDRNDNSPVITDGDYDFSVCPTRNIGATLGTLVCTDQDSSFQGNNETYFSGGGGGITVLASGAIIMSSRPSVGETFTTTATCWDRGQYPGPLESLSPMSISVTGAECPTTIAPATTAAPVVTAAPAATTTTAATVSTDNGLDWIDENLPWIIIAALLATALLALLAFLSYLYCWRYCRQRCQRPPHRPRRLKTPPKQVTPVEEPAPPPPPAIVGTPSPYLYDFWKERYPDDDYGKQPDRKSNPRPVTPEHGARAESGNDVGEHGGPASGGKKSKYCTIL